MLLSKLVSITGVVLCIVIIVCVAAALFGGCASSLPRGTAITATPDSLVILYGLARVKLVPADTALGSVARLIVSYPPASVDLIYGGGMACVIASIVDSAGRTVYALPRQCIEVPAEVAK